jgi:hypothetical protein
MRTSYTHSHTGTGVAFLLGENGEDNAARSFPSVHCFVHQSLAIQLATEWIGRHRDSRRIGRGTLTERYRGHLILVKRIKNRTQMVGEQAFTSNSMTAA